MSETKCLSMANFICHGGRRVKFGQITTFDINKHNTNNTFSSVYRTLKNINRFFCDLKKNYANCKNSNSNILNTNSIKQSKDCLNQLIKSNMKIIIQIRKIPSRVNPMQTNSNNKKILSEKSKQFDDTNKLLILFRVESDCIDLLNQNKQKFKSSSIQSIEDTIEFFNKLMNYIVNVKENYCDENMIKRMAILSLIQEIKTDKAISVNYG